MNKKYLITIGIFIIILLVSFFIFETIKHTHQNASPKSSTAKPAPLPKEVTIILDENGFSPNQAKIKVGSAIRWINKSGKPETVNSDNYPTNQLHRELNFGVFNNNSSVVHTFTKAGVYGYHNQLNPKQNGKIIVL